MMRLYCMMKLGQQAYVACTLSDSTTLLLLLGMLGGTMAGLVLLIWHITGIADSASEARQGGQVLS